MKFPDFSTSCKQRLPSIKCLLIWSTVVFFCCWRLAIIAFLFCPLCHVSLLQTASLSSVVEHCDIQSLTQACHLVWYVHSCDVHASNSNCIKHNSLCHNSQQEVLYSQRTQILLLRYHETESVPFWQLSIMVRISHYQQRSWNRRCQGPAPCWMCQSVFFLLRLCIISFSWCYSA